MEGELKVNRYKRAVVKLNQRFEIVGEFAQLKDAAEEADINVQAVWRRCNRDIFNEFKMNGYTYRYADDPQMSRPPLKRIRGGTCFKRSVVQIDKDGKVIGRFDSVKQAAKATFVTAQTVSYHCTRRSAPSLGFTFRYAEELL